MPENPSNSKTHFSSETKLLSTLTSENEAKSPFKEFSSRGIYFLVEAGNLPTHPRPINTCLFPKPHVMRLSF